MKPRVGNCLDCSKPITAAAIRKSGRCGPCGNRHRRSDPAFEASRIEAIRRKWEDPAFEAKMKVVGKLVGLRNGSPEARARMSEHGKKHWRNLFRPDVREKTLQAVREKSGKTLSAKALAWCPPEYRPLYRFLIDTKKLLKSEAQAIIFAEIKAKQANLSPFERQERALFNGAALIEVGA